MVYVSQDELVCCSKNSRRNFLLVPHSFSALCHRHTGSRALTLPLVVPRPTPHPRLSFYPIILLCLAEILEVLCLVALNCVRTLWLNVTHIKRRCFWLKEDERIPKSTWLVECRWKFLGTAPHPPSLGLPRNREVRFKLLGPPLLTSFPLADRLY